ncbi:hypothetical protein EJB05_40610, partial [Eragrostis curvula]
MLRLRLFDVLIRFEGKSRATPSERSCSAFYIRGAQPEPVGRQRDLTIQDSIGGGDSAAQELHGKVQQVVGWRWRAELYGKLLPRSCMSIVGFGGIGKTTLATELYGKLGMQFECRAFARSCHKPDVRMRLTSILLQVRGQQVPDDLEPCNLTDTIRAHLRHKK